MSKNKKRSSGVQIVGSDAPVSTLSTPAHARKRRPPPPAPLPGFRIVKDEPVAQEAKPVPRPVNRRQRMLIRIALLLPFVLLTYTIVRGAGEKKVLPNSLLGVWVTSDARYADCYLEITPATVVFGSAKKGYLIYFVSSFEDAHSAGQSQYRIHYTDTNGLKYQLTVVHSLRPRESLFFGHQPGVLWTRRPAS